MNKLLASSCFVALAYVNGAAADPATEPRNVPGICAPVGSEFYDRGFDCPRFVEAVDTGDYARLLDHTAEQVRACLVGLHDGLGQYATIISVGAETLSYFDPRLDHKLKSKSTFDLEAWAGDAEAVAEAGIAAATRWFTSRKENAPEDGFDIKSEARAVKNAAASFYPINIVVKDRCAEDAKDWVRITQQDPTWGIRWYQNYADFVIDHW